MTHLCYEAAVDLLGGILRAWAQDAKRDPCELRALAHFLELSPETLAARLDVPRFAIPRPWSGRRDPRLLGRIPPTIRDNVTRDKTHESD